MAPVLVNSIASQLSIFLTFKIIILRVKILDRRGKDSAVCV